MGFKDWSYWLQGGIIGAVIGIWVFIGGIISNSVNSPSIAELSFIVLVLIFIGCLIGLIIRWTKTQNDKQEQETQEGLIKRKKIYFYFEIIFLVLALFWTIYIVLINETAGMKFWATLIGLLLSILTLYSAYMRQKIEKSKFNTLVKILAYICIFINGGITFLAAAFGNIAM